MTNRLKQLIDAIETNIKELNRNNTTSIADGTSRVADRASITTTDKQTLANIIYLQMESLAVARAHFYNQKTPNQNESWFKSIHEQAEVIYNREIFKKYIGIADKGKTIQAPAVNITVNPPHTHQFTIWDYYNYFFNWSAYNQTQSGQQNQIQYHLNQQQQNQQQKIIDDSITLEELLRARNILEALLNELGTSYEEQARAKHSLAVQKNLGDINKLKDNIAQQQYAQYNKAKAANNTSTLDIANDYAGLLMLGAYFAGSIGISFFLITYKYDKEHFRLEEFNTIEDHHFHITDFDLCFATSLFFLWNIIDAGAVLIDGSTDFKNNDNGWGAINTLNGIQLLAFSILGYYISEHEQEISFDKLGITIPAEDVATLGLSLAAGSFAICMFVCAFVSALKEAEAVKLINTLNTKKPTDRLSSVDNNKDIIKRIDAIRRARAHNHFSDTLTCELTIGQAKAILQIEALCQNKAKTTWFGCGVTMTLVFISSLPLSFGVAAPILATLIMIGLIWNCIDRYQLKTANKLAASITKDILSDTGAQGSDKFYDNIDKSYTDRTARTYSPFYNLGIAKKTSASELEMRVLNTKYSYAV